MRPGAPQVDVAALARSGRVIVVARHGKPALDRSMRMDARDYIRWWAAYDAGGLADGQVPPGHLVAAAADCTLLFSSQLRRARETAAAVAPGREVAVDPVFEEAPLPPPLWPRFIKFKPRTWGAVARLSWWLGHHRDSESRQQAEVRARRASDVLVSAARTAPVAVFAHGWFNRMMRPNLESAGFVCVRDGGDTHWSFRVYHRPTPPQAG
jgi:broad specificity phosphatase PhoE